MNKCRSLLVDERGTETVEWGLMAGIIVSGLVLSVFAISMWLNERFKILRDELES